MILTLYLINVIMSVNCALCIIILGLIAYGFVVAMNLRDVSIFDDDKLEKIQRYTSAISGALRTALVLLAISCLLPSQKTMYMMLGTKLMNESEVPSKVLAVINKKLDEYLAEEKKK